MMRRLSLAFAFVLCAAPLFDLQNAAVSLERRAVPRVVNGSLTQRVLSGSLTSAMADMARSASMPTWAGYAAEAVTTKTNSFSGDGCCAGCPLESNGRTYSESSRVAAGGTDVFVFVRFEAGKVTRLRTISSDCTVDVTGTSLVWLTGVSPAESISYLRSLVIADNGRNLASAAIAAIALHADPAADKALEEFISAGQPRTTREQAAFWMAAQRGTHGIEILQKVAREDMDEGFRRYLAFPLSTAPDDAGTSELIRMAHDDPSPGVRGQALFWLAQKAGAKVAGEIASSVENDPDTEVKTRAVFALSQIPKGDGIPKLVEVAQTNRNPAVRKQAMFWLGQSHDPRALKFIEEILSK